MKTIKDWDDLVDPRTLAFYCLGPDPSAFVLCNIDIEEKKVSVRFVSIDSLICTWFFFFFLQVFSSCKNDDQV